MTTTLLDLTQQGDVGTITDESKLACVQLMDPQKLYELWEKQNWVSQTIDLTKDKEDWAAFTEEERSNMAWNLSSFFVGEERVTTQFTGLVAAYEDQSEEAFLTTQQVDEARHAQHFNRFYEQVVGYDGTFEQRLEQARGDLTEPFLVLFDEHLVAAQDRLLADPADREAKVDFITTYHMVIEGTLALTGQFFITEYLESNDLLHFHMLSFFGMPIGEMWDLEGLAEDCASDGYYDFFFTSAPMNIPGGVGSPPNAIAVK